MGFISFYKNAQRKISKKLNPRTLCPGADTVRCLTGGLVAPRQCYDDPTMAKSIAPSRGVMILAAGQGKRMQSQLPKVLHEIGGEPMLFHILRRVLETAPTVPVAIVVGHGRERVEAAVSARTGLRQDDDHLRSSGRTKRDRTCSAMRYGLSLGRGPGQRKGRGLGFAG